MRSLYVCLGVGVLGTLLAAGWLGQKVLGQPDPQAPAYQLPPVPPGYATPVTGTADSDAVPVNTSAGADVPVRTVPPPQQTPSGQSPTQLPPPPGSDYSNKFVPTTPYGLPPPPSGPSQNVSVRDGNHSPASTFGPMNAAPPQDVRPGKIESIVTTEWVGPMQNAAKVGQPIACQILVRNNGSVPVHQVIVRHQLPDGVDQRGSEPAANVEGRMLSWNLGTLAANQTRKINVQLVAQLRGPLNCYATVTFSTASAMQVQVREPLLQLKVKGPERVVAGEEAVFVITLSNPGDASTENIVLNAKLSEGLEHRAGPSLKLVVEPLAPQQTQTMRLVCMARGSGQHSAEISATAETNLEVRESARLEILLPKLDLAVSGPKLRYIDRHAVYSLKVSNPCSVPASGVVLTEVIPAGFTFHQASGKSDYDKIKNTVVWNVGDLPPGQNREVTLDLVAKAPGEHRLVGLANSARGVKTEAEVQTRVEGLSKLEVDVEGTDPVEVGAETTYKIRVVNRGTKTETNIQTACQFPEQMEFCRASQDLRHRLEGRNVVFDALPSLPPGSEVIYSVTAKGMVPRIFRVHVRVSAESLSEPMVREEVTRVYNDEAPVPR